MGKTFIYWDNYASVTFLEPPAPGRPHADPRMALPVDLGRRLA